MAKIFSCIGVHILILLVSVVAAARKEDYSMVAATAASRRFAYTLYETASRLEGVRKNVLVSPLAVGMSLSMLSSGASGWSSTQILKALEQSERTETTGDIKYILQAYHKNRFNTQFIFKKEITENHIAELRSATRLYGERKLNFRDDFVHQTGEYGIEMAVVPFKYSPRKSWRRINSWVQDQTEGNIKEIIEPKTLNPDTLITLVCALYFKASWETPFTNITEGNFYLYNGRTRPVIYMTSQVPLRFVSSRILQADLAEIAYASPDGSNVDASLIFILPHKGTSILDVDSFINNEVIHNFLSQNKSYDVRIQIPKFSLVGAHNPMPLLKRMGVREIFNKEKARLFNAIVQEDDKNPKRVYVGDVNHKSRFEIDETGTQGDPIITIMKDVTSSTYRQRRKTITYDRAFIFLLYDKFTNTIIYMGRLSDPTQSILS